MWKWSRKSATILRHTYIAFHVTSYSHQGQGLPSGLFPSRFYSQEQVSSPFRPVTLLMLCSSPILYMASLIKWGEKHIAEVSLYNSVLSPVTSYFWGSLHTGAFLFFARQPSVSQGLKIEASCLHSDTPQPIGLLWTSDQLVAETSTWQHTTLTTDRHPCRRRYSNSQSQPASGGRPTP